MKCLVYNQNGEKGNEYNLNDQVFGLKPNRALVQQVIVAQLANARQITAHTKTRGEVSGGGRKPWKQKGTGRARQGSIRAPQWKGGGVVFGPRKNKNYLQKINKKMKVKAFLVALSEKVSNNKLIILDKIELSAAKTKEMTRVIQNFIDNGCIEKSKSKILFALKNNSDAVVKAAQNLSHVNTCSIDSLNILDILKARYVILTLDSLKKIESRYVKHFRFIN